MQRLAGHPRPVQKVDRAGGDQRGLPGRLGDHGVARRQRRAYLADEDGEREVPRADAGEHAAPVQGQFVAFAGGPGHGVRPGEVGAAPEGVIAAEIDGLAHLGQGVGDGLAGLAHAYRHQLRHFVLEQVGGALQTRRPFAGRRRVPAGSGRGRLRHGPVDVFPFSLGHRAHLAAAVGGIENGPLASAAGGRAAHHRGRPAGTGR